MKNPSLSRKDWEWIDELVTMRTGQLRNKIATFEQTGDVRLADAQEEMKRAGLVRQRLDSSARGEEFAELFAAELLAEAREVLLSVAAEGRLRDIAEAIDSLHGEVSAIAAAS